MSDLELERELGLTTRILAGWKSGKSKTYKDIIPQIADYFGVTTDYLLRDENNFKNEKENEGMERKLEQYDIELLKFIEEKKSVTKNDVEINFGKNSHFVYRFDNMVAKKIYLSEFIPTYTAIELANVIIMDKSLEQKLEFKKQLESESVLIQTIAEKFNVNFKELKEAMGFLLSEENINVPVEAILTRYEISGEGKIAIADYEAAQNEKREQAKMIAEELFKLQKGDTEFEKEESPTVKQVGEDVGKIVEHRKYVNENTKDFQSKEDK